MKQISKRGTVGAGKQRRGLVAAGVAGAGVAGLWGALHLVPAFGPAVADGIRAVVGPAPVAWAEDAVLRHRGPD